MATAAGGLRASLDGVWHDVRLERIGETARYLLDLDGRRVALLAVEGERGVSLQFGGASHLVERVAAGRARRGQAGASGELTDGRWLLRSPLTGAVVQIEVAVGDVVAAGAVLVIVEAMKMQNELRARMGGSVTAIPVAAGDRVEPGTLLVEITPGPPEAS